MTICAFPAPTAPKQGSGSATNLLHLRLGLLQPPVAAQVRGRPGRPPSRGDPLGGRLLSWVGPWGRKAETKCAQSPAVRRADPPPPATALPPAAAMRHPAGSGRRNRARARLLAPPPSTLRLPRPVPGRGHSHGRHRALWDPRVGR